jgi:uncharacterized protein
VAKGDIMTETTSRTGGKGVHPDLEPLLKLQEKDMAVGAADQGIDALGPAFAALDAELGEAERRLETARRGISDATQRRGDLEGKIESYRVMQERRRQRLEWVRGAKEASTLMAELDLARSVLAKEEAEFMRSGDAVTEAEKRAAEAEQALEQVKEAQAPKRAELEAQREALAKTRATALDERQDAAKGVKPELLQMYERIRRGKAPYALFALRGDACGRCFTAVPMHRRVLIQRGTHIELCEACGVLLYAEE